jgi:hypothetical protein
MKKVLVGMALAFTLVAGVTSVGTSVATGDFSTLGLPSQH